MIRDISYCYATDCENTECERHPEALKRDAADDPHKIVSMADFRPVCKDYMRQVLELVEKENKNNLGL